MDNEALDALLELLAERGITGEATRSAAGAVASMRFYSAGQSFKSSLSA